MGDILFLAHRAPDAPDRGDKIRSFHLLAKLRALATVHVVAFDDFGASLLVEGGRWEIVRKTRSRSAALAAALATGKPISLTMYESAELRARVDRILAEQRIETIFAFSGQMAQFVPICSQARFVMDFVDMDSAKFGAYAQRAGPLMRWLFAREQRLLGAFEREVALRADTSLFVSEAEAAMFRSATGLGADRIRAVENGIDLTRFDPQAGFVGETAPKPLILFTGQMDYPPNVEAVTRFARDVLPRVRQHYDATFAIVGRAPTTAVSALAGLPGVIVTGAVADTRPWLAAADVVVTPLLLARGIQNKLLEAMAMGRPTVATPAAFEGVDAVPGRDLVVADLADQADAIRALLDDPAEAARIGANGRRRMIERYDWAARLASLDKLISCPREGGDPAALPTIEVGAECPPARGQEVLRYERRQMGRVGR